LEIPSLKRGTRVFSTLTGKSGREQLGATAGAGENHDEHDTVEKAATKYWGRRHRTWAEREEWRAGDAVSAPAAFKVGDRVRFSKVFLRRLGVCPEYDPSSPQARGRIVQVRTTRVGNIALVKWGDGVESKAFVTGFARLTGRRAAPAASARK
jgi:hypothetical protein